MISLLQILKKNKEDKNFLPDKSDKTFFLKIQFTATKKLI